MGTKEIVLNVQQTRNRVNTPARKIAHEYNEHLYSGVRYYCDLIFQTRYRRKFSKNKSMNEPTIPVEISYPPQHTQRKDNSTATNSESRLNTLYEFSHIILAIRVLLEDLWDLVHLLLG